MKEFEEAVAQVAAKAGLPLDVARGAVTVPKERDRGDLSLPCFPFGKALGQPPPAIAAITTKSRLPIDQRMMRSMVGLVSARGRGRGRHPRRR